MLNIELEFQWPGMSSIWLPKVIIDEKCFQRSFMGLVVCIPKVKSWKRKALPRFELRLLESESNVITNYTIRPNPVEFWTNQYVTSHIYISHPINSHLILNIPCLLPLPTSISQILLFHIINTWYLQWYTNTNAHNMIKSSTDLKTASDLYQVTFHSNVTLHKGVSKWKSLKMYWSLIQYWYP